MMNDTREPLGVVRGIGVGLALVCSAGLAMGQAVPPTPPVLDVNQVRPGDRVPEKKDEPKANEEAVVGAEGVDDGPVYRVSKFGVKYRREHEQNPALDVVLNAPVKLGVLPSGYAAPRAGLASVTLRVGDVIEGTQGRFHQSGLNAVARGVSEALNKAGYFGVFTQIDPDDIDNQTGADLRERGDGELTLVVWLPRVKDVRSVGSGERLRVKETDAGGLINSTDRAHTRIREQSPVQAGDVLRKDKVDDYIFRLNRHPGRNVGATIAPAGGPEDPEAVSVDYNILEVRPWSVYAQVSNTGTPQTSRWRERFGFQHNQLSGYDDILRVDYITSNFDQSNAIAASYEFPIKSDSIRTRLYGVFSDFDASNVGLAGESFTGETLQIGAEVSWLVWQSKSWMVDAVGGARWQNIKVTDGQLAPAPDATGDTSFLIPYLGARLERNGDSSRTDAGVTLEFSLKGIAATEDAQVARLGRRDADSSWSTIKYNASHSFYLEPLLYPDAWKGKPGPDGKVKGQTLAHEVALSLRGQYTPSARLIAQEQDVLGGLYSVRGYPESATAGDTTIVASAEYRYHWPRAMAPASPGTFRGKQMPTGWPFGKDFRWQPQQAFGATDWDLILKGFLDVGQTSNNDRLIGEFDNTLAGAGVGVELQFKRNATLRLDWGFALSEVDRAGDTVDVGDNRLHVVFTVVY